MNQLDSIINLDTYLRLYQAVADMQRFHFNKCHAIPSDILTVYNQKKTTRPRGQGSPQSYWVIAAAMLNLTDSPIGIIRNNNNPATLASTIQVRKMSIEEREGERERSTSENMLASHYAAHERTNYCDISSDSIRSQASTSDSMCEDRNDSVKGPYKESCEESDVSLILLSLKASR